MKCLNCDKDYDVGLARFCTRSCSTSYTNRLKPKRAAPLPEATCLNCQIVFLFDPKTKAGKFCSNSCRGLFVKKQTRESIENGTNVGESGLREYLVEKFGESCVDCGIGPVWNGKPLTLHMDHKDGNSDNNHWTNVQLLCPNCHTQTPTYGAKGMGSRYKKITKRNAYLRQYKLDRVE